MCVLLCSCCNSSRCKCWPGCLPRDHLHWNLLPEKVRINIALVMHHHNVCHFCMQMLTASRVEMTMGMGFPMEMGIPWDSHGNGNW